MASKQDSKTAAAPKHGPAGTTATTTTQPTATAPVPNSVGFSPLPAGWPTVLTQAATVGGWGITQHGTAKPAAPLAYVNKRALAKGATPGWGATFTRNGATFTCHTLLGAKGTHHGGVYELAQGGKVRIVRHGYVVAATLASPENDKGLTVVADNDETRKRTTADDS